MNRSLVESQIVAEIAQILYDFLPGKAHPFATQSISFAAAASKVGLSKLWVGGSKRPAITTLLDLTLEKRRDKFCPLVIEIVRQGMVYRNNKGNPITREQIKQLNTLIQRVGFKIPELWDPAFLDSLPTERKEAKPELQITPVTLNDLKTELMALNDLDPRPRGFAFERLLQHLFEAFGLAPRSSFRLVGEQIDGSFQIGADTYLVEAKWHDAPVSQADLLVFREKVESKSTWSRGLFISHSGFSDDGLAAFSKGRSTNIIGMNGQDIYFILEGETSLVDAINRKARWAAETGEFFISIFELNRNG